MSPFLQKVNKIRNVIKTSGPRGESRSNL